MRHGDAMSTLTPANCGYLSAGDSDRECHGGRIPIKCCFRRRREIISCGKRITPRCSCDSSSSWRLRFRPRRWLQGRVAMQSPPRHRSISNTVVVAAMPVRQSHPSLRYADAARRMNSPNRKRRRSHRFVSNSASRLRSQSCTYPLSPETRLRGP